VTLADSHVHLHAYDDHEIASMLDRAADAGVETVVAVSVDAASAARTVGLCHPRVRIIPAVGVHPLHVESAGSDRPSSDAMWREIERLAAAPGVAAIGECGVDPDSPADSATQLAELDRHCQLAAARGLPLLLHLRGHDLVGPALDCIHASGAAGVVHYFVGDAALAERYLAAGLLIAVGKPVTRAANASLREAVQRIPLDRLLLETDTYPLPGRSTEPADINEVALAVAALKAIGLDEVATTTQRTLMTLLR
jgi:TatD DNase family protein